MNTIFIKNMVCDRCIMVVQNELEKLGLDAKNIKLGEVILSKEITSLEKENLSKTLEPLGFEVIDDKKGRIIEKIKNIIIDLVHHQDSDVKTNLSDVLSDKLHHDYNYLSNLFSEVEGTTIEKYFIAQKVEKVKELLVYDELSLSEIANRLNYSSVAYLSNQFKKVTGLTPSHFKQIKEDKRKPLDKLISTSVQNDKNELNPEEATLNGTNYKLVVFNLEGNRKAENKEEEITNLKAILFLK